MTNFSALSAAELVAAFNALVAEVGSAVGAKPVARFADRKTAIARCEKIERARDEIVAARAEADAALAASAAIETAKAKTPAAYVRGTCPSCGSGPDSGNITRGQGTKSGDIVNEHQAYCHGCGHEFNYDTGRKITRPSKTSTAAAAALIAASWADPEVRAARLARVGVRVLLADGTTREFHSVAKAFIALGVPTSKIIPLRLRLKADGEFALGSAKFVAA